jgi:hypothetical protein
VVQTRATTQRIIRASAIFHNHKGSHLFKLERSIRRKRSEQLELRNVKFLRDLFVKKFEGLNTSACQNLRRRFPHRSHEPELAREIWRAKRIPYLNFAGRLVSTATVLKPHPKPHEYHNLSFPGRLAMRSYFSFFWPGSVWSRRERQKTFSKTANFRTVTIIPRPAHRQSTTTFSLTTARDSSHLKRHKSQCRFTEPNK